MLYFSELNESEFNQINELKNAHGSTSVTFLKRNDPFTVAFPHEVYSLRLDVLKKDKFPTPQLAGVRAIEIGDGHFSTIFDIHKLDGDSEPQRLLNSDFVEEYEQAFEILAGINNSDSNYTVQLILIPALHVEAIWLHDKSLTKEDQYLPVRSFGLFKDLTLVSREEFFLNLRNAAEQKQQSNDLLGG